MLTEFKSDERGRLKALNALNVLDTGEEQPFEKIVALIENMLDDLRMAHPLLTA